MKSNSAADEFIRIMRKVSEEQIRKYFFTFLKIDMRNSFFNMLGKLDLNSTDNDLRYPAGQVWQGRLQYPFHQFCSFHGKHCDDSCQATGTIWKKGPLVSKQNSWNWLKYLGHAGD